MDKGGINTKIEGTWIANSKSESFEKSKELINMAGRWDIGIEVSLIKPYTYTQNSIKRIIK